MSYTLTIPCGCSVYVSCNPHTRVAHARIVERRGPPVPRDDTSSGLAYGSGNSCLTRRTQRARCMPSRKAHSSPDRRARRGRSRQISDRPGAVEEETTCTDGTRKATARLIGAGVVDDEDLVR